MPESELRRAERELQENMRTLIDSALDVMADTKILREGIEHLDREVAILELALERKRRA